MELKSLSQKELLELAYTATEEKILELLATFESMFIRRAVARNIYATTNIINKLASDPVQNVSYMAYQHKNCTLNRTFCDDTHMCVVCSKDERTMDCSGCNL